MRLGISSYTYGWAVGTQGNRPADAPGAADLIARAAEFRVRVLQLCDNLPESTYTEPSVAELAAAAARAGVSLELGTRGCAPDHLRRFCAISARLGSPILRVVLDAPDDHPTIDEAVRRLRAVAADCARLRVTIAVENHDRFRAAALARIVRESGPHVGVCLDTVNSFGALEGPEVVVETLGPIVVNLHLKDFAVTRFPHLQGFTVEGRPAGRGMLDIPRLLSRLRDFGRDPSAILELWTPPEPDPRDTIRKEADWARTSVETVRQWIKD